MSSLLVETHPCLSRSEAAHTRRSAENVGVARRTATPK